MGKTVALTLLLCVSPALAYIHGAGDLRISISLTEGEHSRDNNSTSTAVSINGSELVYDKSYSGYRAGKRNPVHKEIRIKAGEMNKLREVIAERKLLISHRLEYPTNGSGRYSVATISLALGNKRSSIKVSGGINEIENEPLYKSAQALVKEIERIVEANE
jgi:hypothetical protein